MIDECTENSGCYATSHIEPYHLDGFNEKSSMSVYCTCGRIVILGKAEMKTRLELGKELECMSCRNRRISREIDMMNDHYNGIEETDEYSVDF